MLTFAALGENIKSIKASAQEHKIMKRPLVLHIKNKQTKLPETITSKCFEKTDYGFFFTVASELEAFKAAFEYRNSAKTEIEYSTERKEWLVTVLNN